MAYNLEHHVTNLHAQQMPRLCSYVVCIETSSSVLLHQYCYAMLCSLRELWATQYCLVIIKLLLSTSDPLYLAGVYNDTSDLFLAFLQSMWCVYEAVYNSCVHTNIGRCVYTILLPIAHFHNTSVYIYTGLL